jgi:hypothetical protein
MKFFKLVVDQKKTIGEFFVFFLHYKADVLTKIKKHWIQYNVDTWTTHFYPRNFRKQALIKSGFFLSCIKLKSWPLEKIKILLLLTELGLAKPFPEFVLFELFLIS